MNLVIFGEESYVQLKNMRLIFLPWHGTFEGLNTAVKSYTWNIGYGYTLCLIVGTKLVVC